MRDDLAIVMSDRPLKVVAKTSDVEQRLKCITLTDDNNGIQRIPFLYLVLLVYFDNTRPYTLLFKDRDKKNIVMDNMQVKYIKEELVRLFDTDYYITKSGNIYKHIIQGYYEQYYLSYGSLKTKIEGRVQCLRLKYLVYKTFGEYKDKVTCASDVMYRDGDSSNNDISNLYTKFEYYNKVAVKRTVDMIPTIVDNLYVTEDGHMYEGIDSEREGYVIPYNIKSRAARGISIARIFYIAFYGEIPDGYYVYRCNENENDYSKSNLYISCAKSDASILVLRHRETSEVLEFLSLKKAYKEFKSRGYTKSYTEFVSRVESDSIDGYEVMYFNKCSYLRIDKIILVDKYTQEEYEFNTYQSAYKFICKKYNYEFSYVTFLAQLKKGTLSCCDIKERV